MYHGTTKKQLEMAEATQMTKHKYDRLLGAKPNDLGEINRQSSKYLRELSIAPKQDRIPVSLEMLEDGRWKLHNSPINLETSWKLSSFARK